MNIPSKSIVAHGRSYGLKIRNGSFLSDLILESQGVVNKDDGVVRISLSHYNSFQDVNKCMDILESMEMW